MTILQAAILGLVQGLAEFLPISSSGHLILARAAMGIADKANAPVFLMLDILLHLGTLVAVIVIFWQDWMAILRNLFKSKTLLLLIIASVPALITILLFNKFIESEAVMKGKFLGFEFLITGAFLLLAEKLSNNRSGKHAKRAEEPAYKHAIAMGCLQAVALLPGVSRSGSALLGGVASGLSRKSTAKFAFMMSAPAILGSLIFEGKDALEQGYFKQLDAIPVIVGMLVAAVSGYLAIQFMLRLINRISLGWFALYLGILGIAIIALQLAAPGFLQIPSFLGGTVS